MKNDLQPRPVLLFCMEQYSNIDHKLCFDKPKQNIFKLFFNLKTNCNSNACINMFSKYKLNQGR